jgi:hypothetical protein
MQILMPVTQLAPSVLLIASLLIGFVYAGKL